ncbi:MAG: multicopper oxidase domain-containing protein [Candidatus Dormibacteraeota bacterium]|nr:multicopper oxidase domain-containing protein [Candidatus Dormibacteraeota bacterium]
MGDRDGTTVMRRGVGVAKRFKRFRWLPLVALGAIGSFMLPTPGTAQGAPLSEGLMCTTSNSASFVLTASSGYISTPDGNSVFMWSYANGNSSFQYPGPVLCVNEGDNVTVTLKNTLPVATSLVFPGLTRVKVDGQPVQLDVGSGSLSKPAQPNGSVTYTFQATNPGTFLYQSGTNPELQVLMGMVGALIVRPKLAAPAGTAYVYDDASTAYDSGREFMHLLTEIDPHMHHAIELETCTNVSTDPPCQLPAQLTYDMTKYQPRYWMINGRSFPDDITPNNSTALPSQPYGALVHVLPKTAQPLPALVRFLNGGPVNYPFHPHSNHDSAVGVDGRVLVNPNGGLGGTPASTSFDRFGFVVAPGQTSDALFNWVDAQQWDPQSNPIGVTQPGPQNRTDGPYWSGSPYLGVKLPLLNGITQWNQCGEYYHFAHSHALFQATNYGTSGGGMLTLIRVDPPPDVQKKYGQNCNGGPGY